MLRRSILILSDLNVPSGEELEKQVLFNRIKNRHLKRRLSLRAISASRAQGFVAGVGIILGAAIFLGPWMADEYREMMGYKFVPLEPSQMPRTSPAWWENEWRKMNPVWRAGESKERFYEGPYLFILEQTGRCLFSAKEYLSSAPPAGNDSSRRHGWLDWLRGRKGSDDVLGPRRTPQVLVPLCGDSPIMRTMALQGYEVDAVDVSETALTAAVERTERGLPVELYSKVRLHWMDFFSSELWDGPLKNKKFDIIYERQGMTSLNREQRQDYAYLLQEALRDDGLIYVEGIFRTGRVKGNKVRGPPYSLSRMELQHLFPESSGFFVRCEETNDAMEHLSRENRILQRVPRSHYVTPFHCVVFREGAVNLTKRGQRPNETAFENSEAPFLSSSRTV